MINGIKDAELGAVGGGLNIARGIWEISKSGVFLSASFLLAKYVFWRFMRERLTTNAGVSKCVLSKTVNMLAALTALNFLGMVGSIIYLNNRTRE